MQAHQTGDAEILQREPALECDVVMKGGITSGVVYPEALSELAKTYRIRGIGGASAGAIGAAAGAAAEFGRSSGGYERLAAVPEQLGDGMLAKLFQPQPSTRLVLNLMLVATGSDRPGPVRKGLWLIVAMLRALITAFPVASLIGAVLGASMVAVGVSAGGSTGWMLALGGLLLLGAGWVVAILIRLVRKFTIAIPENLFGICRGLRESDDHPGFTDWLVDTIDDIAGLGAEDRPLRFGQLWVGGSDASGEKEERRIDLRMITTCLSEGRPYEMPWEARRFFYDPEVWRTLFPARVVDALEDAPPPSSPDGDDDAEWRWEEAIAAANGTALQRLPDAQHLPVIVATRLSLSFPLLISAVPLWTIDRGDPRSRETTQRYRDAVRDAAPPPASGLRFVQEWFTDGGFCADFPLHLFDAALPTRPTFAINLGRFPDDAHPAADQRRNVEWATDNGAIAPTTIDIPERGFGAIGAFGSAAVNTARNWQDSSAGVPRSLFSSPLYGSPGLSGVSGRGERRPQTQ